MNMEQAIIKDWPTIFSTSSACEVPLGYKKMEAGVIPEDWKIASLSELFEFRNGVNAEKRAYGIGIPFINVLEVILHTHIRYPDIPGRVMLPVNVVGAFEVRRGDILFNRTSETQEEVGLAAVYIGSETVVFGGFVIRGRRRSEVLDPVFSGYALRAPSIREQIVSKGQGAVRANIGQQELSKVRIVLPPLPEQQAIAAALSDADALIASLDKLIAKKRDMKAAAMQQLLTGRKRLPGFDGEWTCRTFSELGAFSKGSGIRRDEVASEGIPCTRYGEIYTRYNDYAKELHSFISVQVASLSQRIQKGDLLFAGSGETLEEIGKCVAYLGDQEAYAGGDIVIFTPRGQDSMFLGYLMNHASIVSQKARMGQGDAVVHISAKNLGQLQVKLPSIEEQRAIAAVLSDMDAEITALEARRDKMRAIKQGMMQELLTGRIRLV